ncbi:MAG: DUF5916 domain-containing protein [Rhodothermales bacterium]|jgi:hypothetical protein|nr:DUF5916 domain-containing protein [Rhodothermales bacterium]MDG2015680.1 DUF5916 domain-containing protein [Rhodothermales bacterium]HAY35697.1 hypothetical protein [Bacteroidota bacterium]
MFPASLRCLIAGTLLFLATGSVSAASTEPDPNESQIPRIEGAELVVDGVLSEGVWSRALSMTGFTDYLPVDGRSAQDSTQVLVWYSPTAIHFGIRAYESHGEVRATLADRDKIAGDDQVMILLDTYNDQRQAFMFAVNPFGQQGDGIFRDASGESRNSSAPFSIDNSPDFLFESKGRLTEYGFEVEVTIPFKSLRYQSAFTQDWGFNVMRVVRHSGYTSTWTPSQLDNASFMSQNGLLRELTDLRRGLVLDINPELTGAMNRAGGTDSKFDAQARDPLGMNVRWGITNNLTLNGTFNPDFSQVEADVAQIQFDPRQAVYVPEKRPFFLDGIELFQSPAQLIYTRRISNPLNAIKLTGKRGNTNIGVISAIDNAELYLTDLDPVYFNAVRLRRDLSGQNTVGLVYTDKVDGEHWNRVAAVDGRLTFAEIYSFTYQTGMSFTKDTGTSTNGGSVDSAPMWTMNARASGRKYGGSISSSGVHGRFNAESGFINRTGIVHWNIQPHRRWFGDEGDLMQSWQLGFTLDGTWDYDRFTAGNGPNDRKLHFNSNLSFRGGWSANTSVFYESFKMPTGLYDNYYIENQTNGVATDTTAFVGVDRLINLGFWSSISTPRLNNFSGNIFLVGGVDDNFNEWARADIYFITLTLNYNPTDQLRFNLLYNHQQYVRHSDKSTVSMRRVPRLKAEYQVSPSLFVRLVGQYDSFLRDTLRDDSRTNDPILIRDPASGEFRRTQSFRSNQFRVDWLVSYRPNPGTVMFVGYGNSSRETNTYRFKDLQRLNDGFFMKLSYVFRV